MGGGDYKERESVSMSHCHPLEIWPKAAPEPVPYLYLLFHSPWELNPPSRSDHPPPLPLHCLPSHRILTGFENIPVPVHSQTFSALPPPLSPPPSPWISRSLPIPSVQTPGTPVCRTEPSISLAPCLPTQATLHPPDLRSRH